VNTAINQMDQGTQQSAAMAEESTAATHALAQESDELVRLVSQFRLGKDGAAGHAAKVAPVRAARSGATGRAAPRPPGLSRT